MDTILKTTDLSKHYKQEKAVNKINVTVKRGEIYGFLGRNGAGKTTTIRMLLGLIKPTQGKIQIFGDELTKSRESILKRTGSTIEYAGFYPNLTGVENLEINYRLTGIQDNDAIDRSLKIVGLWDERNKVVGNYSMGMCQRLGIARAILHNPELLILDEPTNGLDPVGIKEVRKLIKSLAVERDITIFMSSHILSEVQQLATKIGIIHNGILLEEIELSELQRRNRRYIEIKVSHDSKAAMLLENKFAISDYKVYENGIIRVYTYHELIEDINELFVKSGIKVSKLGLSEDNLEDYFVKLTGGELID